MYRIPEGDRAARGRPVVNLLDLQPDDIISAVVPVGEFAEDRFLFTATRKGIIKKTVLSAYGNVRRDGIIALKVQEDDNLIGASITDGSDDVMLVTRSGQAVRFTERDVRPMGRVSTGVKGIALRGGDEVVDMVVLRGQGSILTICENGYGKRTEPQEYSRIRRGGMGVIDIKTTARNGSVVACKEVSENDEVMIVTQNGIMIRVPVAGIRKIGRNTEGVRVINLDQGDRVIDMTRVSQSREINGEATVIGGNDDPMPDSGNGREPPPRADGG